MENNIPQFERIEVMGMEKGIYHRGRTEKVPQDDGCVFGGKSQLLSSTVKGQKK